MDNAIGEFLRARRELVRPEDVDLEPGGRRRVSGLRREEVAMLAGVSSDYYVRLEQGRERNPSAQVVDALAHALALDEDATAHLHALARPRPRARRRRREHVSPALTSMMAAWTTTPAVVLGRCLDVLAGNDLGRALFAGHTHSDDLVRLVFLDPDARDFYPEWERVAVNIRQKKNETKRFRHSLVGELTLSYEAFTVNGAPGQQLVVYHAEPGSPSAETLALLGSLTA